MSHLSTDRLAALADERPTADEQNHVANCAECARELEAHRTLLRIAGSERDAIRLPLTRWESLAPRLRVEGLMTRSVGPSVRATRFVPPGARSLLRFAAAVVLIAGGVVMGRLSAGASVVPGGVTANLVPTAIRSRDSLPAVFSSVEDANRWREAYADAYQRTVSFLAARDTAQSVETPAVMKARLSALDRVSRTMRQALNDAPYDPVINDFYLNSFGQREATLRQLNTVLPQGVRLSSF